MIDIRPSADSDIKALCNGRVPVTMRAYSLFSGDTLLGVFGLERHKGYFVAFSNITNDALRYPKQIVKCGKMIASMVERSVLPVYAVCSKEYKTADSFLRHIGFVPYMNEVYIWQRQQR